jgi:predicted esterase
MLIRIGLIALLAIVVGACATARGADVRPTVQYEVGGVVRNTVGAIDWYVYVPHIADKEQVRRIFLSADYEGSEDYRGASESAGRFCREWARRLDGSGYVIVVPAFPRDYDVGYYPQGINYHSLRRATPDRFERPDLVVTSIIDELALRLRSDGYPVSSKILLGGYSAGGMFANRYTVLHPERVQAAAIGQSGGMLTMPMTHYDGTVLKWPMGVADIPDLLGEPYTKRSLLQEVPQLVFIGRNDRADYAEHYPAPSDLRLWGRDSAARLRTQTEVLASRGYNVTFRQYNEVGHRFSTSMRNDMIEFLMAHD